MIEKSPFVLECRDLCVSYFTRNAEIPAVIDFDLTVKKGEAVGLVGESGCGKSTVALAIMRYLGTNGAITKGLIRFMGEDISLINEQELQKIRGSRIAMVYQEPMASLNPSMRLGEQLMEVPIFHDNVGRNEASDRAMAILESVHIPDPSRIMKAYPHQISGGQQQRIVIAMALLSRPDLLLLDEPTTALDVTVEAGIIDLIGEISNKFGTSMIYISHNLGLIRETCDRLTVMYSGQAVEEGPIGTVFDNMCHPYTRGLFSSIPVPGADKLTRPLVPIRGQLPLPHMRPKGCYFGPRCDYFDAGKCGNSPIAMHSVEKAYSARCARLGEIIWKPRLHDQVEYAPPGNTVLRVSELRKHYEIGAQSLLGLIQGRRVRTIKANEELNFDVRQAETLAIVGESGCGKSTFAKVLVGLEKATGGRIEFEGDEIAKLPVRRRPPELRKKVQMVFQNPFDTLNPSHTVGGQLRRVLRIFGHAKTRSEANDKALALLDMVKLPHDFMKRLPRQLSGGQKQRVGIARAFAGSPSLVVADEPVSALDVSVQAAVTKLLNGIQQTYRTTLVFISHDLSLVRYLSDRVVVMYLGHVVEQGNTDQVFSPPYHPYTEALLSAVPIADAHVTKKRIVLKGDIPSPLDPPSGCPFQTRCPHKIGAICETDFPPFRQISDGHSIACHLSEEVLYAMEPVIQTKDTKDETLLAKESAVSTGSNSGTSNKKSKTSKKKGKTRKK